MLESGAMNRLPAALLLLALASCTSSVSTAPEKAPAPPPGDMKLLPGYEHRPLQGIDTAVGEIVKGERVVIRYDIGPLAGDRVRPEDRDKCLIYEEKRIEGQTARFCSTSDGLDVTFAESSANFFVRPENEAELQELVTMVESFRSVRTVREGE